MKLPCIDCICLAICKGKISNKILTSYEDLFKSCSLLRRFNGGSDINYSRYYKTMIYFLHGEVK